MPHPWRSPRRILCVWEDTPSAGNTLGCLPAKTLGRIGHSLYFLLHCVIIGNRNRQIKHTSGTDLGTYSSLRDIFCVFVYVCVQFRSEQKHVISAHKWEYSAHEFGCTLSWLFIWRSGSMTCWMRLLYALLYLPGQYEPTHSWIYKQAKGY